MGDILEQARAIVSAHIKTKEEVQKPQFVYLYRVTEGYSGFLARLLKVPDYHISTVMVPLEVGRHLALGHPSITRTLIASTHLLDNEEIIDRHLTGQFGWEGVL